LGSEGCFVGLPAKAGCQLARQLSQTGLQRDNPVGGQTLEKSP
jgi:hypothetical protein